MTQKATKLAELEEVKRTMEEKEVLLQKERHLVEVLYVNYYKLKVKTELMFL